jgi:site-specific DNA recombinase
VLSSIEPIVGEDLWIQCNVILDERRSKGAPARRPVHLFAGVTVCQCGHRMYVPSNTPKYVCYKCRNKIAISDLEAVFIEQLKGFVLSPEDIASYLAQADDQIRGCEERLGVLAQEKAGVEQEMSKVYRLYMDDQITPDGFGRTYKPLEARLKELDDETPRLQGEADFLKIQLLERDELIQGARDLATRWPDLTADEKRQIVEAVVTEIRISKSEVEIALAYLPSSVVNGGNKATRHQGFIAATSSARAG